MIIDAKDTVLGRMAAYAAKQLLLGSKVEIVNCEECAVSGKKQFVLGEYIRKLHRGAPAKGPFFYRRPDMFVKRTVRGMLPFKRARGREAFKNIKCHIGVPENLKNEKAQKIKGAGIEKLHLVDCLKIKDICRATGGKQ